MMLKKLTAMPYAQAHVEIDNNGNINLFSYVTRVVELTADGWLTIYGLYSMTTRRHISAFLREYAIWPNGEHGTYQEFKNLYDDGYAINLMTGEVRKVSEEE